LHYPSAEKYTRVLDQQLLVDDAGHLGQIGVGNDFVQAWGVALEADETDAFTFLHAGLDELQDAVGTSFVVLPVLGLLGVHFRLDADRWPFFTRFRQKRFPIDGKPYLRRSIFVTVRYLTQSAGRSSLAV
jgi:hypothetical protein